MSEDMLDGSLEDFRTECLDAIIHIKTIPRVKLRGLLVKAVQLSREFERTQYSLFPEAREDVR